MTDRRLLTLSDIADQRAYERERDQFRRRVIAAKRLRRVSVGPVVTCTFESRLTMRFQVQEMARAERMTTDEQIQRELDVYNRLLPAPGELSATLFLELTDQESLRRWLPALVGIERSVALRIGDLGRPGAFTEVRSVVDADHASHLTRETVTSAVHYIRFPFEPAQVDAFVGGPVSLVVDHPAYPDGLPGTVLQPSTVAQLLDDLTSA